MEKRVGRSGGRIGEEKKEVLVASACRIIDGCSQSMTFSQPFNALSAPMSTLSSSLSVIIRHLCIPGSSGSRRCSFGNTLVKLSFSHNVPRVSSFLFLTVSRSFLLPWKQSTENRAPGSYGN